MIPRKGFEAYFDTGLGHMVTGYGDIRKSLREVHGDRRDAPSPGDVSARRDRINEAKKERNRRR